MRLVPLFLEDDLGENSRSQVTPRLFVDDPDFLALAG